MIALTADTGGMEPINVSLINKPDPSLIVGGVDITKSVETFAISFSNGVMSLDVVMKAEAAVMEFPCHVTKVINGGEDLLADLDQRTVDGWVTSGGMSESPGTRVLRHLREWVVARS